MAPNAPKVKRPFVLASVMAALFMIAIEATIVSTAMPQIASQLGDLHLYSWVFAAFLLTQTATTVVFGKLADLFGRKPILLVGIGIFLVGSVLCGVARSMTALIAFRLLQGVGAGAIQPICLTVVGDLYPGQQRGKIQGYLASIWGISSVLGPLAGGIIIQNVSWAWIFWINVPVGLAAAAGFWVFLHERVTTSERKVDVAGAALFTIGVAALMVGLTDLATSPPQAFACFAVTAVSGVLFGLQERRVSDPMVKLSLWTYRPIATANVATLLSGMTIIGLTTFLPMYVQGVLGRSALVAGFALTMMVLGWPIGATLAARYFPRYGLRQTLLLGGALLPTGAIAFVFLAPGVSPVLAGAGSTIVGLGMGFLSTSAIVIVQDSVGWAERASATASNIFSRNLGSTLGATALGAILNISLADRGVVGAASFDELRRLLGSGGAGLADAGIRTALGESLHLTFWAVFAIAFVTLLLATLVPRVVLGQSTRPITVE